LINSNIKTNQGPLVPALDPAKILPNSLTQQGLPVPTSALDYARQNATADIPQNTQSTGSANAGPVPMPSQDQAPDNRHAWYSDPTDRWEGVHVNDESMLAPQEEGPTQIGSPQVDMMGKNGMPLTYDQAQQLQNKEVEDQYQRAKGINYDYTTEAQMEEAFPQKTMLGAPISNISQREQLVSLAKDLGQSLIDTSVQTNRDGFGPAKSMSAMTQITSSFGITPVQAANKLAVATSLMLPVFKGATDMENGVIQDKDTLDLMSYLTDFDGAPLNTEVSVMSGGLLAEPTFSMLASAFTKLNEREHVNGAGQPVRVAYNGIPAEVLGPILADSLVDNGVLVKLKADDGVTDLYRVSPMRGNEIYKASRMVAQVALEAGRGRAQKVPVTSEGRYSGAANSFREKEIYRPGAEPFYEKQELARVFGSVGINVSGVRIHLANLLLNNALGELHKGATQVSTETNPARQFGQATEGLPSTMSLFNLSTKDNHDAILAKTTTAIKQMNYMGQHLVANTPLYAPVKFDPTSMRAINDTDDLNYQSSKLVRGLISPHRTPLNVSKTNLHMQPISVESAKAFYEDLNRKIIAGTAGPVTDYEAELGFLAALGNNLDVHKTIGLKDGTTMPWSKMALVTPDFLLKAARKGAILASIAPQSSKEVASKALDMTTFAQTLTPEQQQVLTEFIEEASDKNWGFKLAAYLDAANYLTSKKNGTPFTPSLVTEIDQNSAGRAFSALDSGDETVLDRTGFFYPTVGSLHYNTKPLGSPRTLYARYAENESVDLAISDDKPDLKNAWKEIFKVLQQPENVKMMDRFGKPPLMTTDYGMPVNYHLGESKAFLSKYPQFEAMLAPFYPKITGIVQDMNEIHTQTLLKATRALQRDTPKKLVFLLQSVGRLPRFKGFYGEQVPIGAFMSVPNGEYSEVTDKNGNTRKIEHTRRRVDPMAKSKAKSVEYINDEGDWATKPFDPAPGSSASNSVGPFMGQYRESIVTNGTAYTINSKKKPSDMLFVLSVFDNLLLDSRSYLRGVLTANNVVLPKAAEFDLPKAIADDFTTQVKAAMEGIINGPAQVDIGKGSQYKGLLLNIDNRLDKIQKERQNKAERETEAERKIRANAAQFEQSILKEGSGYVKPDDRGDEVVVSKGQLRKMFNDLILYELFYLDRNTGTYNTEATKRDGHQTVLARWVAESKNSRMRFLPMIKKNASEAKNSFMD
jgi:hypothetical protein